MDSQILEMDKNVNTELGANGGENQKRTVKLTEKGLAEKLDRLQNTRKSKLNKAGKIRDEIKDLISNGDRTNVLNAFDELKNVCEDAKGLHQTLLCLLSNEEGNKHEIWFTAKMLPNNECFSNVNQWLSQTEPNHEDEEVTPADSVSNTGSKGSQRSSKSSASAAKLKVAAEKAAVLARVKILKEKHAIEEEEARLRRRKEMLDLEAELAASEAKLEIYDANEERQSQAQSNTKGVSIKGASNGMNILNPAAQEFIPHDKDKQTSQKESTQRTAMKGKAMDVRPKVQSTSTQHHRQMELNKTRVETKVHSKQIEKQPLSHTSLQWPEELLSIMSRQTEITVALMNQQLSMTLPPRDIPIFDGDPLKYRAFIKAFEHGVEKKAPAADSLYYLEQFTQGQPRELVRSCQHMPPDRGYVVAKALLQDHFGNPYKTATAYINKALLWQTIRTDDTKALQSYALFLRGCCNIMEELEYVQELDMPVNMRAILAKLPYKLRECWRNKAHDIMESTGYRAGFNDMVEFIERHVKILSDPFFGDLQEYSTNINSLRATKPQSGSRMRGNVVASTVTAMEAQGGDREQLRSITKQNDKEHCVCCSMEHLLEHCKQFKRKRHVDKVFLLKKKGVCFGCLQQGHISRDCEARLTCEICDQNHPTVLHINRQPNDTEREMETPAPVPISSTTCGHTGAGKDRTMLSVLPVRIKAAKGNYMIQTYAFLDPGSTGTFCSEQLMRRLSLTGKRTQILLRTMGQTKKCPAFSLFNLEVGGLESSQFYPLPEVITQQQMPVTTEDMVKAEDLIKWPYLSKVHMPSIHAEVDLLIGTNAPKLLEPWEVINSQGNGPYAVRTVLGWVVNGPLNGNDNLEVANVTVNRISVSKLEELLMNQYNHDFSEKQADKQEMSREDLKFLHIMDTSAKLQDGKYCVNLPFKK